MPGLRMIVVMLRGMVGMDDSTSADVGDTSARKLLYLHEHGWHPRDRTCPLLPKDILAQ